MKRYLLASLLSILSMMAQAQWRVASAETASASCRCTLLQVQATDDAVYVFGNLALAPGHRDTALWLPRRTTAEAGGLTYKLTHAVNLPIEGNSDLRKLYLAEPGDSVNFVLEFEKFPLTDGFSIHAGEDLTVRNIRLAEAAPEEALDADRFLDCNPDFKGEFHQNGATFRFFIHDQVMVAMSTHTELMMFRLFDVRIVNRSDHPVVLELDSIRIEGIRYKKGEALHTEVRKERPEDYDRMLEIARQNEAKERSGADKKEELKQKLREEANNEANSDWERAMSGKLASLVAAEQRNAIENYLETHPNEHTSGLRSTVIPPGEAVEGYVPTKDKKFELTTMHILLDGFDFSQSWKN